LNQVFVNTLKNVLTENLTKEEFLVELERNPDEFCSLRLNELDDYSKEIVWECIKVIEKENYNGTDVESKYSRLIREHFGLA
jgi:hypothetical protein